MPPPSFIIPIIIFTLSFTLGLFISSQYNQQNHHHQQHSRTIIKLERNINTKQSSTNNNILLLKSFYNTTTSSCFQPLTNSNDDDTTTNNIFHRDPRSPGVEPVNIEEILLYHCNTTNNNDADFPTLLHHKFSTNCPTSQPRLTIEQFICTSKCPIIEPELESTIRLMRLGEHSAKEHVISLCKRKIIPVLVWISKDGRIRYYRCVRDESIPFREFRDAAKLMRAVTCLVDINQQQDFVLGFDPNDFVTPTFSAPADTILNYLYPLPGIVRFVGTKAHSVLLFPTGSHIVATAHCLYRHPQKWWKMCTAHQHLRDTLPFSARNKVLMWRGLPTGVPWSPLLWRFHQRAVLVREFGNSNITEGFDVGFVRKLKRVANSSQDLYVEMKREWHQKDKIPKDHHPKYAHLIHVDGNTASWGLSHKLNSGSTVLWIQSSHDYREHFYVLLKPWKHYIPISVDLSDLLPARDFVWSHPVETEAIAKRTAQFIDQRMRAQDLYCYVMRLLLSIKKAQVRGELASETMLREALGDERFESMEEVKIIL
jgi:hypothetical protein